MDFADRSFSLSGLVLTDSLGEERWVLLGGEFILAVSKVELVSMLLESFLSRSNSLSDPLGAISFSRACAFDSSSFVASKNSCTLGWSSP